MSIKFVLLIIATTFFYISFSPNAFSQTKSDTTALEQDNSVPPGNNLNNQSEASPTPAPSVLQGNSNSLVAAVLNPNGTYTIDLKLPASVPQGDVIYLELRNNSDQKIWDSFTVKGGTSFSPTTGQIQKGSYILNLSLFTPNRAQLYAGYSNILTINSAGPSSSQISKAN